MIHQVFAKPKGTPPRVEWIALDQLLIDHGYQRLVEGKASKKLITTIAENWDWRLLAPLTVSHRDGSYGEPGLFVIDGQHRLESARLRGDILKLPCIISKFESFEAEALAFVNINSARRQVTALDRYHARVAAKEAIALAIKEVVEEAGLSVTRHNDAELWQPGEISFPDAIGSALAKEGASLALGATETALSLIQAWQGKPLLQGREMFSGLLLIANSQWDEDDDLYTRLLGHISAKRQALWIAQRNHLMHEDGDLRVDQAMARAFIKDFTGVNLRVDRSAGQRRFKTKKPGNGKELTKDHEAMENSTSLFTGNAVDPGSVPYVLKSGHNSSKIGREVMVGRWKGFPILTLTLEERATCPSDCVMLAKCYGNNMHWAPRYKHGPALERKLEEELEELQVSHPNGFVIRLHVLGDFYSLEYVDFWERMLAKFRGLNIYGYTARDPAEGIGARLLSLSVSQWERFALRFSNQPEMSELAAIVIKKEKDVPENAFVCPAQTGKTDCCATCGACWESERNVAFLEH